jgi:hypothetical protein
VKCHVLEHLIVGHDEREVRFGGLRFDSGLYASVSGGEKKRN